MKLAAIFAPLIFAVLAAGCGSDSPRNPGEAAVVTKDGTVPYYGGDICEWLQQNLFAATRDYENHKGEIEYDWWDDVYTPSEKAVAVTQKFQFARANARAICANPDELLECLAGDEETC